MNKRINPSLCVSLCLLLTAAPLFSQDAPAAAPEGGLRITIIDGEGALNNVKGRLAREPIVQVQDEHHNLVPGALVTFALPENGAGATFANGAHTLTVTTDQFGRAAAYGMQPNTASGQFQIQVSATYNGQTAHAVITQTNVASAAASTGGGVAAAAKAGGLSTKLIVTIIAIGAAAAAGGTYFAVRSSSKSSNPIAITAGTGTVSGH